MQLKGKNCAFKLWFERESSIDIHLHKLLFLIVKQEKWRNHPHPSKSMFFAKVSRSKTCPIQWILLYSNNDCGNNCSNNDCGKLVNSWSPIKPKFQNPFVKTSSTQYNLNCRCRWLFTPRQPPHQPPHQPETLLQI